MVEGPSDLLFFDWLARQGRLTGLGPNVGVLDAFGKFELHRASATLSLFGIPHVVLWDEDAAMPTGDGNASAITSPATCAIAAIKYAPTSWAISRNFSQSGGYG